MQQKAASDMLKVMYGDMASYHFMCRFFLGFFQHHPMSQELDHYWRMEPHVHYYCDLDYDPFLFLEERGIQKIWLSHSFAGAS